MGVRVKTDSSKLVSPTDLKDGQVGIIEEVPNNEYKDGIVMRRMGKLLYLSSHCPTSDNAIANMRDSHIKIRVLPQGTKLEIY